MATIFMDTGEDVELEVNSDFVRKKYFSSLGDDPKKATIKQYRQVFLKAADDFIKGNLPVDDLDWLAGEILFCFRDPIWFEKMDGRFCSILFIASDLSFYYLKKDEDDHCKNVYTGWVEDIKIYLKIFGRI